MSKKPKAVEPKQEKGFNLVKLSEIPEEMEVSLIKKQTYVDGVEYALEMFKKMAAAEKDPIGKQAMYFVALANEAIKKLQSIK